MPVSGTLPLAVPVSGTVPELVSVPLTLRASMDRHASDSPNCHSGWRRCQCSLRRRLSPACNWQSLDASLSEAPGSPGPVPLVVPLHLAVALPEAVTPSPSRRPAPARDSAQHARLSESLSVPSRRSCHWHCGTATGTRATSTTSSSASKADRAGPPAGAAQAAEAASLAVPVAPAAAPRRQ